LTELSGFHSCTIFQWDPEAEEIHAIVEHSHTVWLPYGAESYRLSDYPTTEHVLVSGEPEIVYMDMDDPEISWMRQIGTPAVLMLPLSSGQETIGLAEIGDFADPSAIDGVTIQACQQLLEEAASWLASPLPANPQAALLALTSRLAEVSNGSWCALSLWDKLGGELRTATEYRSSAWQPGKGPTYTLSGTIYARVLAERTPAIVRWSDPALSPQDRAQLAKWKLSMLVVQPLFVKGEPVGLIELFHATKEPVVGDEELRLWRAVADQAAVAIENARLYAVERERTDELVHTGEQLQQELAVRKRAEEQIRRYADELTRSNQELQQFAYIASHDLQEPLRMVTSYLQLLERRYHGQLDADADEFIQFAVDGAQRMHELIRDLLAYSRVGTLGGPFVPVDCERVFGQVLDNLKVAIRESEATVTCDPLPAVMADPIQLGQLFQNLIGNAIKFRGQRSPEIHVSATRHDGDWLISVRDNGIGIEAQYAERIFVIFQRLHTREEYPGTGIGLAVCKRIVERHGGRIWVESQPGQGATFSFTIPSANMTADGQKGA
jgi:signal transduction histidine kinase